MSVEFAVGLLITIVLGIAGLLAAKKVKTHKQNQKIQDRGSGYQAGGDINIGAKLDE